MLLNGDLRSQVMPVYSYRLPISFIRGKGIWLWDDQKNSSPYLDALSGRGVCNLGHSHPQITKIIQHQAGQLIHTCNLYRIPQQEQLATLLCEKFNMTQAFFANSGAEAIEAILKIAKLYAYQHNISDAVILTLSDSYHGRSLGALSVSNSPTLQIEKNKLNLTSPHVLTVPINDCATLQKIADHYQSRIKAVLFEPIQGDGGIQPCSQSFLNIIQTICKQYHALMIADEIQSGLCRTGTWLACEHFNVFPDIIVLAKALGNGIPIAAYLVNEKTKDLLKGKHGSTFSGNPFSCAVALEVIKILQQEKIYQNATHVGNYLQTQFKKKLKKHSQVLGVEGKGLMIGIRLEHTEPKLLEIALSHKLLVDIVNNNTLRILPPLTLQVSEADELVFRLQKTLSDYLQ